MSIEDALRVLYIFSLVSIVIIGLLAILLFPASKQASISQSLSKNKKFYILSAFAIAFFGLLFSFGLAFSILPSHSLPTWSLILVALAYVCMFTIAWIPTYGDKSSAYHKIHFSVGGILGVLFIIIFILTLSYSQMIDIPSMIFILLVIVYCSLCFPAYLLIPKAREHFLGIEIVAISGTIISFLLLAL